MPEYVRDTGLPVPDAPAASKRPGRRLAENTVQLTVPDPLGRQILIFLMLLAIACGTGFIRGLNNSDELWNYAFAVHIANGLVPYRDFNMLQTPLAAAINALALTIFGHHLFVIRMTGGLLFAGIGILLYRNGRRLGGSVVMCLLLPLFFICLFYYNIFLEYSCLIVFLQLLLIALDLRALKSGREPGIGWLILTGMLGGCAILSKQTFGAFICAASWLSIGLIAGAKQPSFLRGLRAAFFRAVGSAIPCFIFLCYLLVNDAFDDFMDMCFYGISTFSSHYSYTGFLQLDAGTLMIGILLPVLLAVSCYAMIRWHRNVFGQSIRTIFLYAVFGLINLVPLANEYHVYTCSAAILLLFIPLTKRAQSSFVLTAAAAAGCGATLAFLLGINPYNQLSSYHLTTEFEHLELTFITDSKEAEMREVCGYVEEMLNEGREVYILDNDAELFFAPTETYHKYLNMFLYGNLGTKEPSECLEESLTEGAVYLIASDDRSQTQFPKSEIRSFTRKYLTYVESIDNQSFYVYTYEG